MSLNKFIEPYVEHGIKAVAVRKITVSIPLHVLQLLSNERTRRQVNNLRHATNSDLLVEAFLHAFTGQPLPTDEELRRTMATTKKTVVKKPAAKKAVKKTVTAKAPAKKVAVKKVAKKAAVKKVATKTPVKKAVAATKAPAKKVAVKKVSVKKATPAKVVKPVKASKASKASK